MHTTQHGLWLLLLSICFAWSRATSELVAVVDAELHALETATVLLQRRRELLVELAKASTGIDVRQEFFIDQAHHQLGSGIDHIELISLRMNSHMQHQRAKRKLDPAGEFMHLLAVARADGVLALQHPLTLAEVWAVRTGVANVTALTALSGNRNAIALVSGDGSVTVLALRVFENSRLIMGEFVRRRSTDRSVCLAGPAPSSEAIAASGAHRLLLPHLQKTFVTSIMPTSGLHMEFEVLFTTRRFLRPVVVLTQTHYDMHVVIGTADATLVVLDKAGDVVRRLALDAPVVALTQLTGGSVAFSASNGIGMVNVYGHGPAQFCVATTNAIVSLARDAQRPLLLYAGTAAGSVLLLHLHWTTSHGFALPSTCHVLAELRTRAAVPTPPLLLVWRKHVFVVVRDQFAGFRVPDDRGTPELLFEKTLGGTLGFGGTLAAAMTRDAPSDAVALLYTDHGNGTRNAHVLQLLLAHEEQFYDVTWIRTPLMVLCAGSFIVWQRSKKKSTRGGGVDEEEIMRLAQQLGHRFNTPT
ncbi:hypothetical protein ACHHYP_09480 [Achlya hypogyna]|uniref:Secreted protein n=1 Tax=Achlya hypogyna TaxID=1202772 RepID=A0A0A7CP47_ACHHY|nr:secreted protein [Achlya hypogyna]OQR87152.1 hypothetical protein ACHHYP_09480 [Achlya hypogyna]